MLGIYYDGCAKIDQHSRCRQDDVDIEKCFEVKEWSRGNSTLLSICIVDSYLLHKNGSSPGHIMSP